MAIERLIIAEVGQSWLSRRRLSSEDIENLGGETVLADLRHAVKVFKKDSLIEEALKHPNKLAIKLRACVAASELFSLSALDAPVFDTLAPFFSLPRSANEHELDEYRAHLAYLVDDPRMLVALPWFSNMDRRSKVSALVEQVMECRGQLQVEQFVDNVLPKLGNIADLHQVVAESPDDTLTRQCRSAINRYVLALGTGGVGCIPDNDALVMAVAVGRWMKKPGWMTNYGNRRSALSSKLMEATMGKPLWVHAALERAGRDSTFIDLAVQNPDQARYVAFRDAVSMTRWGSNDDPVFQHPSCDVALVVDDIFRDVWTKRTMTTINMIRLVAAGLIDVQSGQPPALRMRPRLARAMGVEFPRALGNLSVVLGAFHREGGMDGEILRRALDGDVAPFVWAAGFARFREVRRSAGYSAEVPKRLEDSTQLLGNAKQILKEAYKDTGFNPLATSPPSPLPGSNFEQQFLNALAEVLSRQQGLDFRAVPTGDSIRQGM